MNYAWILVVIVIVASACIPAISAIDPVSISKSDKLEGPGNYWGNAIIPAQDDGYIVVGGSAAPGATLGDALAWKPGEWYMMYGWAQGFEVAGDVLPANDGYVIAGYTNSTGAGEYDAWIVKIDRMGVMQWNKTFGGEEDESAKSIVGTPEGGYVLAGGTDSFNEGVTTRIAYNLSNQSVASQNVSQTSAWVVKLDSNGTEIWNRTYREAEETAANDIIQTSDGYVVAGVTEDTSTSGVRDAWVAKLDANGTELWSKTYGYSEKFEDIWSIAQTPDGYVLAGYSIEPSGNATEDAYVVKLDSNGTEIWNRTYHGAEDTVGTDVARDIVQVQDGYVFAGYTNSTGAGGYDAWVVHLAPNGSVVWSQTFGGSYSDGARGIIQTADGLAFTGNLRVVSPVNNQKSNAAWLVVLDGESS